MEKTITEIQFEIGLGKALKDFTKEEKEILKQFTELEGRLN